MSTARPANETLLVSSVTVANNGTVRASGGAGQGDGNITLTVSIVSSKNGVARLDASNDITISNALTSHRASTRAIRRAATC